MSVASDSDDHRTSPSGPRTCAEPRAGLEPRTRVDASLAVRAAAMERVRQVLAQEVADVNAVGVEKTPTFYVNGRPLARFHPDELRALVQQEVPRHPQRPGGS